ncbi:MAG: 50S ribosomal protein L5 [Nanoarchaeota archaeon]|nr:50S ribosomal protein L5 [Nanoarchaeota archaeon]MBU4352465.1 50S ribosomal protein L5 [Nanoarchaeota archaeon]MBU4456006.1 50S ribosomal protein L5 [Nanoarchaeota archaeon]
MSEVMKKIRIEKITLNIGVGKPGPELEKALKLLGQLTNEKPVETKTQKRIPTWGVRPGLSIGAKITLRGKKAEVLLKRLLESIDFKLSKRKIDKEGNFAFGIKEYLDVPEMKYDMDIGIMGFEVAVTVSRPGNRVKLRRIKTKKIPKRHRITKEETIQFLKDNYGIKFKEEEETEQ